MPGDIPFPGRGEPEDPEEAYLHRDEIAKILGDGGLTDTLKRERIRPPGTRPPKPDIPLHRDEIARVLGDSLTDALKRERIRPPGTRPPKPGDP